MQVPSTEAYDVRTTSRLPSPLGKTRVGSGSSTGVVSGTPAGTETVNSVGVPAVGVVPLNGRIQTFAGVALGADDRTVGDGEMQDFVVRRRDVRERVRRRVELLDVVRRGRRRRS